MVIESASDLHFLYPSREKETRMQTETSKREPTDVATLNGFLRGELAAVEAYRVALDNLDHTSEARSQLEICRLSHQDRVDVLRQTIAAKGGQPVYSSGPWGMLTNAVDWRGILLPIRANPVISIAPPSARRWNRLWARCPARSKGIRA